MTDTKFTPGPWEVPDQTWARTLTVNTSGGMDSIMIPCQGSGGAMSYTDEVCTLSWGNNDEWLANAHLIAAAPDLYEALDDAVNMLSDYWHHLTTGNEVFDEDPEIKPLKAALAKARGES